jgi:hypothetical protein
VLLIDTSAPAEAPIEPSVIEPEVAAVEDAPPAMAMVEDPLPPPVVTGPVTLDALFADRNEVDVDAEPVEALDAEVEPAPEVEVPADDDARDPTDVEHDVSLLLPTLAVMPAAHPAVEPPAADVVQDIAALARLEEVRAEIAELSTRRLSIRARRRLSEAQAEERAILTSLGYDSYLDLMLRNAAGARQPSAPSLGSPTGGGGGGKVLPTIGGTVKAPAPGVVRSSIPGGTSDFGASGWLTPPPPPPAVPPIEFESADATTSAIVDAWV